MSDARLVARRFGAFLKFGNAPGDFLPGADALVIAFKRKRANLLGDVDWRLFPVSFQHRVGAGPQLPVAQRHRWPRQ